MGEFKSFAEVGLNMSLGMQGIFKFFIIYYFN